MNFFTVIQVIGVAGAIMCWVAGWMMVSAIREREGKPNAWYRTFFLWWVDFHEMRQAPGPKPENFSTLSTVFWLFLVFGLTPNILRFFV
jgi:hypothetical protein